jgi:hypothetical protein
MRPSATRHKFNVDPRPEFTVDPRPESRDTYFTGTAIMISRQEAALKILGRC